MYRLTPLVVIFHLWPIIFRISVSTVSVVMFCLQGVWIAASGGIIEDMWVMESHCTESSLQHLDMFYKNRLDCSPADPVMRCNAFAVASVSGFEKLNHFNDCPSKLFCISTLVCFRVIAKHSSSGQYV